ncbi:MAG: hypothetical protein FWE57_10530 [Chitinispirillia bacterium]|nr:hypothetical protein [Chitinispirillia bacterium]
MAKYRVNRSFCDDKFSKGSDGKYIRKFYDQGKIYEISDDKAIKFTAMRLIARVIEEAVKLVAQNGGKEDKGNKK